MTADLMGGYVKENGVTSLVDPGDWEPIALDFLAETTSATSARELTKASLSKTKKTYSELTLTSILYSSFLGGRSYSRDWYRLLFTLYTLNERYE
jgi:hypothetical protein